MNKTPFADINYLVGLGAILFTFDGFLKLMGGVCTILAGVSYYYNIKEKRMSLRNLHKKRTDEE